MIDRIYGTLHSRFMAKKSSAAAAKTPDLIVSQPISLLEREIKADLGGLFKSLGLAAAHIGTKKYYDLAADAGLALSALSIKPDPGGLAWLLIRRSLLRAMQNLTEESWLHRASERTPDAKALEDDLDGALSRAALTVSKDFFRQPGSLSLLPECAAWFHQWLLQIGFDQPKATSISSRLRSYFVYALNQEWRAHAEFYAPIVSAATTPFTPAGERERAWEQYRAWLDQELDSPMFGEPFSLRQLYVPLRAYYERLPQGQLDMPTERIAEKDRKRIALDFTDHLLTWVQAKDKNDACRVVSGGPGSGKSSVAKMFTAAVLAQTGWRALYIPLHRIKYKGEIIPAIHQYLSDTGLLPGATTPLERESGEPQLLLIFDGLDELAMLGKIAQTNTSEFVRAVKDLVRDHNTTALRLKVILTGRTVVMQGLESEFRKKGEVIHLCPYKVTEEDRGRYELGWELLAESDQRQLWWRKYGELTGQGYTGLPESLNREDLLEVSAEPLLNYLLALAYQSGGLDFSREVTQNQIYATLIHEVYDRRWSGGGHFAVNGMSEDHFQRVLEEIAVASWHGDGRKTTVGEIKQHCADAKITRLLETFQDGAENGVLRLLTAFFFRKAGERNDENAFEFTHKSFGEYLVARRVVRMIQIIEKRTREAETDFDGWDTRQCLEEWARLCGPTAMNLRQWDFLKNEMHLPSARPQDWQPLLVKLINALLRQGMPMEKLGLPDFLKMQFQARNAEEALLLALSATARVTKQLSEISWPEPTSFGAWIKRLQGQRGSSNNAGVLHALDWLCLDKQVTYSADLFCANLRYSSCKGMIVRGANLIGADLSGANLIGADLSSADISVAYLEGTDLTHANLSHAELVHAILSGADLTRADLGYADLSNAILIRADLSHSKLIDADMREVDLRKADFNGANLIGANLYGANMEGVKGLPENWKDVVRAH
jgi:uncharacterized protein YjbI with pentapeptide repeats